MPHYSWIVDRFHLSTRAYQIVNHGHDVDFAWLEQRLRPLGFHLVLCWRRPATFEAARAERLEVSGKPSQYDDLSVFVREQELMDRLASTSLLPTLRLDISDGDVARACDAIADWMETTGGLWPPEETRRP
jgi:hypothetical protein